MGILDKDFTELAELKAQNIHLSNELYRIMSELDDTKKKLEQAEEKSFRAECVDRWWIKACEEFMNELSKEYPNDFKSDDVYDASTKTSYRTFRMHPTAFVQLLMQVILKKNLILDIFNHIERES